jgi:DNA-binding NtrC family response regulator
VHQPCPRKIGTRKVHAMTAPARNETATIMVVDDDQQVRAIIAEFLSASGHHVLEAGDGQEALRILAGTPGVNLLITDVRMPDMSGLELADAATRQHAGLRVILISGYFVSAQTSLRLLKKPFRMQDLAAAVHDELEQ